LIPTLFLILGWGYQPERVQAGIYLLFFTLLASLPLLVRILFIYNISGSLCLFLLFGDASLLGGLFYVCIVFAFLVTFVTGVDIMPSVLKLSRKKTCA
jgi:NADH-ubiquinone oxidoreductase chain 4